MTKNKFDDFTIDVNTTLDDEEKNLLSGLKESKSIFNKVLVQEYQPIAITHRTSTNA